MDLWLERGHVPTPEELAVAGQVVDAAVRMEEIKDGYGTLVRWRRHDAARRRSWPRCRGWPPTRTRHQARGVHRARAPLSDRFATQYLIAIAVSPSMCVLQLVIKTVSACFQRKENDDLFWIISA
jgi:hypothetical protein